MKDKHVMTPLDQIIKILISIQSGQNPDVVQINKVWDDARTFYGREDFKHQFMPVLRQIWKVA